MILSGTQTGSRGLFLLLCTKGIKVTGTFLEGLNCVGLESSPHAVHRYLAGSVASLLEVVGIAVLRGELSLAVQFARDSRMTGKTHAILISVSFVFSLPFF